MKLEFLDVLTTVITMVLLVIPGFVLAKTKIISENSDTVLSNLVLYGCQPFMLFMAFQKKEFSGEVALNMLIVIGISFAAYFIMIGLCYLCFKNKNGDPKINMMRFASVFGNIGFMGLPFLQSLFSAYPEIQGEMLIYGSAAIIVFNILNWTIGVFMLTNDRKSISIKKFVLNPNIIAIALGLICFFAFKAPITTLAEAGTDADMFLEKLMKCINYIGDAVTPLAMILIGIKLAKVNVKKLFLDKWAYITCINKLIIMAFVATLLVAFLPIDVTVKYAAYFTLSMPSAASAVMFAVRYGGDAEGGAVMVLLSTVLSVATIPLMFLLFKVICGV